MGSTLALVNASGAVAAQYAYDLFGNVTASGQNIPYPYQYAGMALDPTGLYFDGRSYYSPALGRPLEGYGAPSAPGGGLIQGIIDFFASLFGGGGGGPTVILPGYRRHPHYPAMQFISDSQADIQQFTPDMKQKSHAIEIIAAGVLTVAIVAAVILFPEVDIAVGAVEGAVELEETGAAAEGAAAEGAAATGNTLNGSSSLYDTSITRAGSKYLNVRTDVGALEFQQNLMSSGFNVTQQTEGATVLSNGTDAYTIYTRTSTGMSGAQYFGANSSIIKFTLGGP